MNSCEDKILTAAQGRVRIRSCCSPEDIRKYTFVRQFGSHERYKSLYTSRTLLEKSADKPDTNVVLALAEESHIIGYAVLAYPDSGERWADLGSTIMMEIQAIEVCRSWRSCRIASAMLEMLMGSAQIEEKILYMVGYSWTWDLKGTRKTAQEYRRMLRKLFEPAGFEEFRTNEPNICLKPENLFMCRIGKNISQAILNRFKWLRFGLSPWTWDVGR